MVEDRPQSRHESGLISQGHVTPYEAKLRRNVDHLFFKSFGFAENQEGQLRQLHQLNRRCIVRGAICRRGEVDFGRLCTRTKSRPKTTIYEQADCRSGRSQSVSLQPLVDQCK